MTSEEEQAYEDPLDGSDWQVPPYGCERLACQETTHALRAEVARLRAAIGELVEDWRAQATADEAGWSYRRGNNAFNEGAAYVLRRTLPELEAVLGTSATTDREEP